MALVTTYGYLETPYLTYDYAESFATYQYNAQVTRVINKSHADNAQVSQQAHANHADNTQTTQKISTTHRAKTQTTQQISKSHADKAQVSQIVSTTHHDKTQVTQKIGAIHDAKTQTTMIISEVHDAKAQVTQKISSTHSDHAQVDFQTATTPARKFQVEMVINKTHADHAQTTQTISKTDADHAQVNRLINGQLHTKHMDVKRGSVVHEICSDGGYLELPYLTYPYLTTNICARARTQVDRLNMLSHRNKTQVDRKIAGNLHRNKGQTTQTVTKSHLDNTQVDRVRQDINNAQVTQVLYNITNLRILKDFPSRGTSGLNWVANSTESGDFSVNNLNTDIVEQVWRSASGVKTGITLTCDTQISQGVFLDTLAVLNHNMTVSASVVLQGSNDAGFSSIGFTQTLTMIDEPNIYYIAPTLPTQSYRYWRFIINDSTNTNNYLQIGTIVFGSSIIFQGECFVDQVVRNTKHFADKIATEGFTNVSNDRALKFATGLEFKNLKYNRGNYRNIRDVFRTARTSLKVLWIPTPQYPERFAVFGKLSALPQETHNVKGQDLDFVNFSIVVDESL